MEPNKYASTTNFVHDEISEGNNPNLSSDFNADVNIKLKGDAIGNTMYSERFVLKTLLRLAKIEWSEDLENDLSSLWDMTTECDVVKFLLKNNFIEVSAEVIKQTEELRLIEIMIGIIGNMCCVPEVCSDVLEFRNLNVFLSVINLVHTPSLIQLMRVLKGLLYNGNENTISLLNENLLSQINFILSSSQNSELLLQTMQVAAEIIDKKIFEMLKDIDFLENTNEAFNQVLENINGHVDAVMTKEHENLFTFYLKVVQNINIFCSELSDNDKYDDISLKLQAHVEKTASCFEIILSFIDISALELIIDSLEFYLISIAEFLMINNISFQSNIVKHFVRIFDIILCENIAIDDNLHLEIAEFLCYSINKSEISELKNCFEFMDRKRLDFILKDNLIQKHQCEHEVIAKINLVCS